MLDQIRLETAHAQYNALACEYGGIKLELRSSNPEDNIPFGMVQNLLLEMKALTARALVGTYEGEIVAVMMKGLSVLIRLRITR